MSEEKTNETKNSSETGVRHADNTLHQHSIPLLPENALADIMESVKNSYKDFIDLADANMTDAQRKRKVGAGNKNYGFIDKASDLAEANGEYVQFFKLSDLKNCIRNVETCRNLAELLIGFWHAATNTMLVYSDDAYSMALLFYNNVKAMSRRGDPMARALAATLKTYFKKSKPAAAEPTNKELLRDAKAIAQGKKDGKIERENVKPHMTGGVHKVVDDVHKGKASFKESEEGSVRE
jgi:hypothetical protein